MTKLIQIISAFLILLFLPGNRVVNNPAPGGGGEVPVSFVRSDGIASGSGGGTTASVTSFQADGTNKLLVLMAVNWTDGANQSMSGATFNTSENFTQLSGEYGYDPTNGVCEIWYLIAPTATTATVTATWPSSTDSNAIVVYLFNDVHQTTPLGSSFATSHGSTSSPSVTVTSTSTTDMVMTSLSYWEGTPTSPTKTPGTGQTAGATAYNDQDYEQMVSSYEVGSASTSAAAYSIGSAIDCLLMSVAVKSYDP